MPEPEREFVKAWCSKCGFWRNRPEDIGHECRRVDCHETVSQLTYRLVDEDTVQLTARLAMELTTALGGLLLLSRARTGVGAREIAKDTLEQVRTLRESLGVFEET
jgi:hypothetical protein